MNIQEIREEFTLLLATKEFTSVERELGMTELVGSKTIEILNANFIVTEPAIFGVVNQDYVSREEEWYNSQSLSVNDIPGGPPAIWKAVSDKDGFINSNYGWCIYSPENGNQYRHALAELTANRESRRAQMIYTRPTMWDDYNKNGRSDFMCTSAVQYLVRNGVVHAVVSMRSNDTIFGFRNDQAWQAHVHKKFTTDLNAACGTEYEVGDLHWNAVSLHVYSKHFYLIHHYAKTGEINISKEQYKKLYPTSEYV